MLIFKKVTSTQPAIDALVATLRQHLEADQNVLWLVPGGSSITIAAQVSQQLVDIPHKKLSVSLTDERYGELNHPDSNWRQLHEAGFSLPQATLFPVLIGKSRDETVEQYAQTLEAQLNRSDFKIGFFGIGADGHTAGILPGSPAVNESAFASGYDAGNFQRITMAPPAILQLNEAVAYAVGESKWPVFNQLETERSVNEQPAQILKRVPHITIFNDHKESRDL